jgi:hypothetical protein
VAWLIRQRGATSASAWCTSAARWPSDGPPERLKEPTVAQREILGWAECIGDVHRRATSPTARARLRRRTALSATLRRSWIATRDLDLQDHPSSIPEATSVTGPAPAERNSFGATTGLSEARRGLVDTLCRSRSEGRLPK